MPKKRRIPTVLPEPLKDGRPVCTPASEARDGQRFFPVFKEREDLQTALGTAHAFLRARSNREWDALRSYCTMR